MRRVIRKRTDEISLEDVIIGASDPFKELTYSGYKDLLNQRTILINGDIEENIIERVVIQIEKMSREHPKAPITILINSYGGYTFDGFAVVDAIRATKTPITTVALGKCMSAAFSIFLAGDLRVVHENSLLMAHGGSQSCIGDVTIAAAVDDGNLNEQLCERAADYYASRTKIQKKEWLDLFLGGRDRYFFSEEAVKQEIAHEIQKAVVRKHSPKAPNLKKKRKVNTIHPVKKTRKVHKKKRKKRRK